MTLLTLYYIPVRARAEHIRMILAFGNVDYNNTVVSMSDWSACKEEKEICPFGQLPSIRLANGKVIAQSAAIVRYVAKLAGLYPSNPEDCAEADMLLELSQEMNAINPLLNFYPVNSEIFSNKHGSHFRCLLIFVNQIP